MQEGEEDFYQQYLEGHKNHSDLEDNENDPDNDPDEEEEDGEDDEGMDYSQYLSTFNSMNRGGFNYPGTFEHNGEFQLSFFFTEAFCCFLIWQLFLTNFRHSFSTGKLYQSNLGYGGMQLHHNGVHSGNSAHLQHLQAGTFSRPRSSSLSMIDRGSSEGASWAILGSTGGYRSKGM